MDNVASHTSKRVENYVEHSGGRIRLHLLPSWCPQSKPVELAWWSLHVAASRNYEIHRTQRERNRLLMLYVDTFLTALYVMVDDLCQFHQTERSRPAPGLETFFALRAYPNPRVPCVGSLSLAPYVAEKGFEGEENHRRWLEEYGAELIHPSKRNSRKPWSKRPRKWIVQGSARSSSSS